MRVGALSSRREGRTTWRTVILFAHPPSVGVYSRSPRHPYLPVVRGKRDSGNGQSVREVTAVLCTPFRASCLVYYYRASCSTHDHHGHQDDAGGGNGAVHFSRPMARSSTMGHRAIGREKWTGRSGSDGGYSCLPSHTGRGRGTCATVAATRRVGQPGVRPAPTGSVVARVVGVDSEKP